MKHVIFSGLHDLKASKSKFMSCHILPPFPKNIMQFIFGCQNISYGKLKSMLITHSAWFVDLKVSTFSSNKPQIFKVASNCLKNKTHSKVLSRRK